MPTIMVNGVLRTDLVLANKVKVDMQPEIDLLDDQANIFELITRQVKKVYSAENTLAEWIEQRLAPCIMTVTAVDAPGTTITVDHPEYAHANQRIYNKDNNEWYLMNEAIGGTSVAGKITVVNQQNGKGNFVTATAVGQKLWIGPETHSEGAAIPASFAAQPMDPSPWGMWSVRTLPEVSRLSRHLRMV